MRSILRIFLGIALFVWSSAGFAQNREVPYWASLRADEVNMRVGPSQDYQVDWIYRRRGLPVKVIRVVEGWRLVQDPDGTQGWMVARLLNPQRTALIIGQELVEMREDPLDASKLKWMLEPGVVGVLKQCEAGWCEIDINGRTGWVREPSLWGTGTP